MSGTISFFLPGTTLAEVERVADARPVVPRPGPSRIRLRQGSFRLHLVPDGWWAPSSTLYGHYVQHDQGVIFQSEPAGRRSALVLIFLILTTLTSVILLVAAIVDRNTVGASVAGSLVIILGWGCWDAVDQRRGVERHSDLFLRAFARHFDPLLPKS